MTDLEISENNMRTIWEQTKKTAIAYFNNGFIKKQYYDECIKKCNENINKLPIKNIENENKQL